MSDPGLVVVTSGKGIHMLTLFSALTDEGVYCHVCQALYFMQRVEPYTTMSNQLKRKMNYADNMFTDIASTWNGVLENVDDVKELVLHVSALISFVFYMIMLRQLMKVHATPNVLSGVLANYVQVPELFYLPEVLLDASEMSLEECETDKMLGMTDSNLTLLLSLYAYMPICFHEPELSADLDFIVISV